MKKEQFIKILNEPAKQQHKNGVNNYTEAIEKRETNYRRYFNQIKDHDIRKSLCDDIYSMIELLCK